MVESNKSCSSSELITALLMDVGDQEEDRCVETENSSTTMVERSKRSISELTTSLLMDDNDQENRCIETETSSTTTVESSKSSISELTTPLLMDDNNQQDRCVETETSSTIMTASWSSRNSSRSSRKGSSSSSSEPQNSYTSLKDILSSSPPEIQHWEDIEIKNPLLQKAAWIYIMTAEPVFNDRRLSSRLWSAHHQNPGCFDFLCQLQWKR